VHNATGLERAPGSLGAAGSESAMTQREVSLHRGDPGGRVHPLAKATSTTSHWTEMTHRSWREVAGERGGQWWCREWGRTGDDDELAVEETPRLAGGSDKRSRTLYRHIGRSVQGTDQSGDWHVAQRGTAMVASG
jgi:hypothetical protein